MLPKKMHFFGPCPFLTCQETAPHDHDICPECGAVRYGNLFCNTCRQHARETYGLDLPVLETPAEAPVSEVPHA